MKLLQLVALLSVAVLFISSTRAGIDPTDLLKQISPSHFLDCDSQATVTERNTQLCSLLRASLAYSLPSLDSRLKSTVENALNRKDGRLLLPISEHEKIQTRIEVAPISRLQMTIIMARSNPSTSISFLIRSPHEKPIATCWLPVSETSTSLEATCRITPSTGFSISANYEVTSLGTHHLVQLDISGVTASEFQLLTLPAVYGSSMAYLLSFEAVTATLNGLEKRDVDEAGVKLSTPENFSSEPSAPTSPTSFYIGPRIVGIVIGSIAFVAIIVALIVTMLVNAKKSPSSSTASTPPLAAIGSGETLGNPDAVPSSKLNPTTTSVSLSTQSSPSLLASLPVAGGVISASMSSTMKGGYSMSPHADTPLQGGVIGSQTSSVFIRASPKSLSNLSSGVGTGPYGLSNAPNNTTTTATTSKQKKTEKVALAEAFLVSPRARLQQLQQQQQVSNTALASLPMEPAPKIKARYLASQQSHSPSSGMSSHAGTSSSSGVGIAMKHAQCRRNVRLVELMSKANASPANGAKIVSEKKQTKTSEDEEKDKEKKKRAKEEIMEDDGVSGFWTDEDDTWVQDIVEPEEDDVAYKNDETFVEIDLDALKLVPEKAGEASLHSLDAHVASITSPLREVDPTELPVRYSPLDQEEEANAALNNDDSDSYPLSAPVSPRTVPTTTSPSTTNTNVTKSPSSSGLQLSKSSEFIPARKPKLNPALLISPSKEGVTPPPRN